MKKRIHSVVKYIFVSLLSIAVLFFVISEFERLLALDIVLYCSCVSAMLLIVYLLVYQSKKPSLLFSASIIIFGAGHICDIFWGLGNYITLLLTMDEVSPIASISFLLNRFVVSLIYIALGIVLCTKKHSTLSVRIWGGVAFAARILNYVIYVATTFFHIYIDLNTVLHLTIFTYTCIMPICNTHQKQKEESHCTETTLKS